VLQVCEPDGIRLSEPRAPLPLQRTLEPAVRPRQATNPPVYLVGPPAPTGRRPQLPRQARAFFAAASERFTVIGKDTTTVFDPTEGTLVTKYSTVGTLSRV